MSQSDKLAGMAAIVTGGAGSIGTASALRLVQDGASVLLMDRRPEALEDSKERILAQYPQAEVDIHPADARKVADVSAAFAKGFAMRGKLDMVVATVGGGKYKPILLHDADSLMYELELNVVPTFLAIQQAVPLMTGGGSIVCVSSNAAGSVTPWMTAYMAAKIAVENIVRGSAEELGGGGIRVNAVRPGLTRTDRGGATSYDTRVVDPVLAETPLGRIGWPIDIAEAIRYLVGPESSWVTGQILGVDGGTHLRKNPSNLDVAEQLYGRDAIDQAMPWLREKQS